MLRLQVINLAKNSKKVSEPNKYKNHDEPKEVI